MKSPHSIPFCGLPHHGISRNLPQALHQHEGAAFRGRFDRLELPVQHHRKVDRSSGDRVQNSGPIHWIIFMNFP